MSAYGIARQQVDGALAAAQAEGIDGEAYVRLQIECTRLYGLEPSDLDEVLESFPLIDPEVRKRIAAGMV